MDERVNEVNRLLRDAGSWMHIRTLGTQNAGELIYAVEEDGVCLGSGDTLFAAMRDAVSRMKARVALLEEAMARIG